MGRKAVDTNLHALPGRIFDHSKVLFDVSSFDFINTDIGWTGVLRLDQSTFNCSCHSYSEVSGFRFKVPGSGGFIFIRIKYTTAATPNPTNHA